MRIEQLHPDSTPFKDGKTHRAGAWSAVDSMSSQGWTRLRQVYHYNTLMLEFASQHYERPERDGAWVVDPISLGHGSVSDQQGVNQLLRGTGWYYSRQGGAQYVAKPGYHRAFGIGAPAPIIEEQAS